MKIKLFFIVIILLFANFLVTGRNIETEETEYKLQDSEHGLKFWSLIKHGNQNHTMHVNPKTGFWVTEQIYSYDYNITIQNFYNYTHTEIKPQNFTANYTVIINVFDSNITNIQYYLAVFKFERTEKLTINGIEDLTYKFNFYLEDILYILDFWYSPRYQFVVKVQNVESIGIQLLAEKPINYFDYQVKSIRDTTRDTKITVVESSTSQSSSQRDTMRDTSSNTTRDTISFILFVFIIPIVLLLVIRKKLRNS